jgi:hypothetical protein
MQMVYGIGIGDALAAVAKGRASADDLVPLRDQARTIVGAQGDLVAAARALDAEIAQRGATAPAVPVVERFVAEIDGVALPAKVKDETEKARRGARWKSPDWTPAATWSRVAVEAWKGRQRQRHRCWHARLLSRQQEPEFRVMRWLTNPTPAG